MAGVRGQTGQPLYLKCSRCRKTRLRGQAAVGELVRTGRDRPYRATYATGRTSRTAYECKCLTCNHIGWYAHRDAKKLPLAINASGDFEPGFVDALHSLQLLRGKAMETPNWDLVHLPPRYVLILVLAAMSILDRADANMVKIALLSSFRYPEK